MNRTMFRLAMIPWIWAAAVPANAAPLILRPEGRERELRAPVLGASTTALFEHLLDNSAKIAALKTMAIGLDRFPGGSDSNFYNWRTGRIEVRATPNSSRYVQFWANAAANIGRSFPGGVTLEQYNDFSRRIGAQVILVPNLETSSVEDQVEWFKRLSRAGAVPERIELGNEYYLGMVNDPVSMARWRDEPTSMSIMKRYVDALRPYLPSNAKLAVQSAAGAIDPRRTGPFGQRLRKWDEDLRPEPWFDAVTVHIYPRLSEVMGNPDAGNTPPTRENALPRLRAMMAAVDEGVEQILHNLERRLPGKEIWVTEWNSRAGNPAFQRRDAEPMSPAMLMLTTTRMTMVYLRHPSVTASLFFMLGFNLRDNFKTFVSDGQGGFAAGPTVAALRWLNEAANAGGSFQRLVPQGARPASGGGVHNQSYFPVEGGIFRSGGRKTLILENASEEQFTLDPATLEPAAKPATVEFMSMSDLSDTDQLPARIQTQPAAGTVTITPFSVTRILW